MDLAAKAEEELIEEKEPSVNYARAVGRVGAALAAHLDKYPDCFRKTGSKFTPEVEDL